MMYLDLVESWALEELLVILVVEDDQPIQSLAEDALTDAGFEPAIAASGEEAVTLLQGNKGKYRALVIDINLRGRIDGWAVAKRAREIDSAFPVIYVTGTLADLFSIYKCPTTTITAAKTRIKRALANWWTSFIPLTVTRLVLEERRQGWS